MPNNIGRLLWTQSNNMIRSPRYCANRSASQSPITDHFGHVDYLSSRGFGFIKIEHSCKLIFFHATDMIPRNFFFFLKTYELTWWFLNMRTRRVWQIKIKWLCSVQINSSKKQELCMRCNRCFCARQRKNSWHPKS